MRNGLITVVVFLLFTALPAFSQSVIVKAPATARYAESVVKSALEETGYTVLTSDGLSAFAITLDESERLEKEAFSITVADKAIALSGGGRRGLIYAAFEFRDQLRATPKLDDLTDVSKTPALGFRAIKHNLPWESYRSSSALDQHFETVRSLGYWRAFLDMMTENRFNALTLWNLHPFPYMIRSNNFPEASSFTESELEDWRHFYTSLFRMAKERGIETYLVNWNVLVSKAFADAHELEGTNYYPYYKGRKDQVGEAQTSELVKKYTRESVTQVLEEYPDLTGFGFSFGEQMGGMTPQERQSWIDDTIIAGMRAVSRPVKMIFRAPFSSDLGQGGSTSKATETLTREAIERLGDAFEGPIWMEIKFNWSHGHSTTDLIKVHGGELKDTYFDPVPENYRVAWMVRNEDFFALRWGSAPFIREHVQKNGVQPYVGGYFLGSENYIPAKDYFTAREGEVEWSYAFQRQWLFYRLWGQLLYDPRTPDSHFEHDFVYRYGDAAKSLLRAYEYASDIQLKFATSIDFSWDATLYSEGMMVIGRQGMEPMSVRRLIAQPTLRSDWLSVGDYVQRELAGEVINESLMTPPILARQMRSDAQSALRIVKPIPADSLSLEYEIGDIKIWAYLGLYYAEKLEGAMALERYELAGDASDKDAAVAHLTRSLEYWDDLIEISEPLYKPMPLTHNNPPNNVRNDDNLFHWAKLRPAIARDLEVAIAAEYEPVSSTKRQDP